MASRFNEIQKFDRDYLDVAGVSPIRCRHEIDLYGVKSGLGKFNPIMVENINKLPEPEDFEDPEILKRNAAKSAKKDAKDPKSAKKEKAPLPAPGKVKTPSKLVLTNQDKGKKPNFDKFSVPATFNSKYAEYMVNKQQN